MNKEKVMDLKKFIKEENPSGQRLQSLRLPRDLNLGGPKITKKQFIPNFNVIRNKDKVKDVTKKIEHKRNIRNNDKQNRQNNSGQKYIQSSGIFSEGIGKKSARSGTRYSSSKENDFASTMTVPTIKKKSWEVDKKNEENIYDEIMANEEEDDDEKLPFEVISWNEKDFKDVPSIKVKTEIKCDIKTEPDDEISDLPINKIKLENSDFPLEEYQDENKCTDEDPRLTLWRLPDSFAGKTLSDDPKCKKLFDCTLVDMPEGQIGKLILRKSGLVEIRIGRMKYNLEPTELGSCREEIVALEVKENQESSAAVLGQIQNRFLLNPDWDSLFNESKL